MRWHESVRLRRELSGATIAGTATAVGLSPRTYRRLERGQRPPSVADVVLIDSLLPGLDELRRGL